MRKICIYTSTRADYGLLRPMISKVQHSTELCLLLLVSGAHLVPEQGMTIDEIIGDGFIPDKTIDIDLGNDSPEGVCRSMGTAIFEYGRYLYDTKPELLILLGDRFEAFCCASAAHVCRIPIAHIHGGETTQGAIDEAFRHSITKMAHLHFPCCEVYRQRIIQLGESPENVYNVGALGVENIRNINFLDRTQLESSIGFRLDNPFFLVTFHPVTLEGDGAENQIKFLLSALASYPDHKVIFTGANTDTGGKRINQIIDQYQKKFPQRYFVIQSLGYLRYLSAMRLCTAVVGNSSSGLLEAPVLRVPTINIGDRQKGRIRTDSIIDCDPEEKSIRDALKRAIDPGFQKKIQQDMLIPFERENTSDAIINVIKKINLKGVLKKEFFNLLPDKT